MTKEQFHNKFLNLLLLSKNKEYFTETKILPIFYILHFALDEKNENLYYQNSRLLHKYYENEIPLSMCYFVFRDNPPEWYFDL